MATVAARRPIRHQDHAHQPLTTKLTTRQLDALHSAHTTLTARAKGLQTTLTGTEKSLRIANREISRLNGEQTALTTKLTRMTDAHTEQAQRVQQLHTEPGKRNQAILELDSDLSTLTMRLAPYFALLDEHADTLGPDGDATQGQIQIIRDPTVIQKIEQETGQPVGILAENKWQLWIADAVQFPTKEGEDAKYGVYGRFVWKNTLQNQGISGAAMLPYTQDGRILLISIYRHATCSIQLELPRGCGEPGEAVLSIIKRELGQEKGATVAETSVLGHTHCDTGVLAGKNVLARVRIAGYEEPKRDSGEESIRLHTFTRAELNRIIRAGSTELTIDGKLQQVRCEDPFLLSALYLDGLNHPSSVQRVLDIATAALRHIPLIGRVF